MNTYTKLIAEGLQIDIAEAKEIQTFIECFYDDFRWGNSSVIRIIKVAKQAQSDMAKPTFNGWKALVNA